MQASPGLAPLVSWLRSPPGAARMEQCRCNAWHRASRVGQASERSALSAPARLTAASGTSRGDVCGLSASQSVCSLSAARQCSCPVIRVCSEGPHPMRGCLCVRRTVAPLPPLGSNVRSPDCGRVPVLDWCSCVPALGESVFETSPRTGDVRCSPGERPSKARAGQTTGSYR